MRGSRRPSHGLELGWVRLCQRKMVLGQGEDGSALDKLRSPVKRF